jgi:hypothetical protein
MVDIDATIRAHLASLPALQAAFSGPGPGIRIFASRNLPAGYSPEKGPALLFSMRGGGQDFSSKLHVSSVQFRAYGADELTARSADRALYDAINDTQARGIAYIRLDDGTLPVLLNEPETGWPYMLSYYRFHIHNL